MKRLDRQSFLGATATRCSTPPTLALSALAVVARIMGNSLRMSALADSYWSILIRLILTIRTASSAGHSWTLTQISRR